MLANVSDNLQLAGVSTPAPKRIMQQVNQAKDRLVSHLEKQDEELFVERASFTLTSGQMSIDLPAGFMRLVGLDRVDGTRETPVPIIDSKQRSYTRPSYLSVDGEVAPPELPVGYLESGKVYFVGAGAPACTLRMRYRKRVDDLSENAGSSSL